MTFKSHERLNRENKNSIILITIFNIKDDIILIITLIKTEAYEL